MRKLVIVGLCVLVVGIAQAQDLKKLGTGDFGLSASISSSTDTVGFAWHLASRVVLMPEVGFYTWNHAVTATTGSSTTNYSGYWIHGALSIYFEANPFGNLYLDIGPQVYYSIQPSYRVDGSTDNYTWSDMGAQVNVSPKLLLTNNLAVFTVLGFQYYFNDKKDTTTGYEYAASGFALVNPNLGIIYYFR